MHSITLYKLVSGLSKLKFQLLVLLSLFVGFNISYAQSRIQNLTATRYKETIQLSFNISAGTSCSGYQIYHSTDSINFNLLHDYVGVCGEITKPQTILFEHTNPIKNSKNYYKILIAPNDFSAIASALFIDFSNNDFVVSPNPISSTFDLHINNNSTQNTLKIYNEKGELVFEKIDISDSLYKGDLSFLTKGIYVFKISSSYAKTYQIKVLKL